MDTWLSIRDKALAFYQRWKAEIQIYGTGLLLTFSGLATGRDKAAAIVFTFMILYDLMRRFGEPYRALGEQEMARRQQAQQQWWREQTEDLLGRFLVRTTPPSSPSSAAAPPPSSTRLISAPDSLQDEEPPESPSGSIEESDRPATPPPIPVVTHLT